MPSYWVGTCPWRRVPISRHGWSPRPPASAACAAALVALSATLPLWTMKMKAPQYPKGLHLYAYGTGMDGDLRELNILNHYIGMKEIHPESIPELKYMPFILGALIAAGVLAGCGFLVNNWVEMRSDAGSYPSGICGLTRRG